LIIEYKFGVVLENNNGQVTQLSAEGLLFFSSLISPGGGESGELGSRIDTGCGAAGALPARATCHTTVP
jgi:hypothetical protein